MYTERMYGRDADRERYGERKIERRRRDTGTVEERTSTRLAWISPSPGHRTWTFGEGEVATATATAVVLRAFHKSRHNYDVCTRRRSGRYCALLDGPAQI